LLASRVAGVLAAWLAGRGRNPRETLWWAWCPTVILEAGNGGHVDILSAAFIVGAVLAGSTRRGRVVSAAYAGTGLRPLTATGGYALAASVVGH
jgi:hypothetical protein